MKEHTKTTPNNTARSYAESNRSGNRTEFGSNNPNLSRLKDLSDYKVASDDPDVRGWDVITGDNEAIGKVDELIVDTKRMKVRYLVADIKEEYAMDKNDHYILIPIGAARLHERNNDVVVSNLTIQNTSSYPVYRGTAISRDYEQSIRRFYEAGGTVPAASASSTENNITQPETIRDAHTGKTYERQDRSGVSGVDSNSRNRVDIVTGTSGKTSDKAYGTGQMSDTPQENRMPDRALEDSNTISSSHSALDRRPDGKTTLGEFNTTTSGDIKDRLQTKGISSSRTANLPNKELRQGPASEENSDHVNPEGLSESERVRIHDTNPDVQNQSASEKTGFNETGDLNRSTSLGNDSRRGSNMGNMENDKANNPGINDRSRMSSPEFTERTSTPGASRHPDKYPEGTVKPVNKRDLEHSSDELPDDRYDPDTDEFYTHRHFDEEVFYGNRRTSDDK